MHFSWGRIVSMLVNNISIVPSAYRKIVSYDLHTVRCESDLVRSHPFTTPRLGDISRSLVSEAFDQLECARQPKGVLPIKNCESSEITLRYVQGAPIVSQIPDIRQGPKLLFVSEKKMRPRRADALQEGIKRHINLRRYHIRPSLSHFPVLTVFVRSQVDGANQGENRANSASPRGPYLRLHPAENQGLEGRKKSACNEKQCQGNDRRYTALQ